MEKFFKKIVLNFCLSFILLNIISIILFKTQIIDSRYRYLHELIDGKKIKVKGKLLIIGDSVAKQIFDNVDGSFASNMNVLMTGQYIIVEEVLKKNPQIETILFVGLPTSIGRAFENDGTYSSFLKPFFSFKYLRYLSLSIYNKMNSELSSYLTFFPLIKYSNFMEETKFPKHQAQKRDDISDISIEYLQKIIFLAKNKNIELYFASPPLKKSYSTFFNNWYTMKKYMLKEFEYSFDNYWSNIIFYPDTCFIDYAHLKIDFLQKNREKIISDIVSEKILRDKILQNNF